MAPDGTGAGPDSVDYWVPRHAGRQLTILPLAAHDLLDLEAADEISADAKRLSVATAATVSTWSNSFTVFVGNKPVVCLGLREVDTGRAVAWAIFGKTAGRHMLEIVRGCQKVLKASPYRRIELSVVQDYKEGNRLALALGFEVEGCLRKFDADGRDHVLYARVH